MTKSREARLTVTVEKLQGADLHETTWADLLEDLRGYICAPFSFRDRMDELCGALTHVNNSLWGAHVMTDKGVKLKFVVERAKYASNMMPVRHSHSKTCWYVYLLDEDFDTSLLELRASENGFWGELVWVQKGLRVSGNQILDMTVEIERCLKVGWFYVLDDSKLKIEMPLSKRVCRSKMKYILLRILLPISQRKPLTWYQRKMKIFPTKCDKIRGADKGTFYTQCPTQYATAVQCVRTTTVTELNRIFPTNHNILKRLRHKYLSRQASLVYLSKRTLPSRPPKVVSKSKSSLRLRMHGICGQPTVAYTVHDLIHRIHCAAQHERKRPPTVSPSQSSQQDVKVANGLTGGTLASTHPPTEGEIAAVNPFGIRQSQSSRSLRNSLQLLRSFGLTSENRRHSRGHLSRSGGVSDKLPMSVSSAPYVVRPGESAVADLVDFYSHFLLPEVTRPEHAHCTYVQSLGTLKSTQIFECVRPTELKKYKFDPPKSTSARSLTLDRRKRKSDYSNSFQCGSPTKRSRTVTPTSQPSNSVPYSPTSTPNPSAASTPDHSASRTWTPDPLGSPVMTPDPCESPALAADRLVSSMIVPTLSI
eukprot:164067_1